MILAKETGLDMVLPVLTLFYIKKDSKNVQNGHHPGLKHPLEQPLVLKPLKQQFWQFWHIWQFITVFKTGSESILPVLTGFVDNKGLVKTVKTVKSL